MPGIPMTAGAQSGLGRIQKSRMAVRKARVGKLIKVGKDLLSKRGKGPKKGSKYKDESKIPITKDISIDKTGGSSLSGTEAKIRGKKANYVVERDTKEIKMIPTIKGKPKYKEGGLTKWFKQKWVDISSKKPGGGFRECGRKSASRSKRGYPKCVPASKAASMTKAQIRSAVARKRAAGNPGGKPTNVKTIIKKASKGLFAEEGKKRSKTPGMETYTGSHIKSDLAGKKVSNKSYEEYYKGMI